MGGLGIVALETVMQQWLLDHAANDIPMLMLCIMQGSSFWMLYCASRKPDSVVGRMLQDENGKPSVLRWAALSGFNIACWVVMRDTLRAEGIDVTIFGIFVAATFGGPIAGKCIDKWNGTLPWAKEKAP